MKAANKPKRRRKEKPDPNEVMEQEIRDYNRHRPLRALPPGPWEAPGRQGFYAVIWDLIEDWDLHPMESVMLMYIAERIWRDGYCRDSSFGIIEKIIKMVHAPKEVEDGSMSFDQKLYVLGIYNLERHGLIKRTRDRKIPKTWTLGERAHYDCNGKHEIEILNQPLRDLLSGNPPKSKSATQSEFQW